jgi:hydrogenase expression/formation protein HypC
MCLAIPGRVEEIDSADGLRMGRVNFGGVVKRVCLDFMPDVEAGAYVIVHAGFAISRIDEETAQATLADFQSLGLLDAEFAGQEEAFASAAKAPQPNCQDGSCET